MSDLCKYVGTRPSPCRLCGQPSEAHPKTQPLDAYLFEALRQRRVADVTIANGIVTVTDIDGSVWVAP
jgi:hypothetical protein